MKSNLRLVHARRARRVAAVGPLASLAACEGEPPIAYPENPPGAASGAVPAPEVASAAEATSAASEAPAQPPTAPCAPCAAQMAAAPASVPPHPAASGSAGSRTRVFGGAGRSPRRSPRGQRRGRHHDQAGRPGGLRGRVPRRRSEGGSARASGERDHLESPDGVRAVRRRWSLREGRSSSPTPTRSRTTSSRPTTRSSTWATSRRTRLMRGCSRTPERTRCSATSTRGCSAICS